MISEYKHSSERGFSLNRNITETIIKQKYAVWILYQLMEFLVMTYSFIVEVGLNVFKD